MHVHLCFLGQSEQKSATVNGGKLFGRRRFEIASLYALLDRVHKVQDVIVHPSCRIVRVFLVHAATGVTLDASERVVEKYVNFREETKLHHRVTEKFKVCYFDWFTFELVVITVVVQFFSDHSHAALIAVQA